MKALPVVSKALTLSLLRHGGTGFVGRSTKQTETCKRLIETEYSKLDAGMKRPRCFNRAVCCEQYVSNNRMLLEEK